jgi:hypothetical protein
MGPITCMKHFYVNTKTMVRLYYLITENSGKNFRKLQQNPPPPNDSQPKNFPFLLFNF